MFRGHPLETPVGVDRSVCIHHYITVYTYMYVYVQMYVCMYYIGRERIRRKFILFHFFRNYEEKHADMFVAVWTGERGGQGGGSGCSLHAFVCLCP